MPPIKCYLPFFKTMLPISPKCAFLWEISKPLFLGELWKLQHFSTQCSSYAKKLIIVIVLKIHLLSVKYAPMKEKILRINHAQYMTKIQKAALKVFNMGLIEQEYLITLA